MAVGVYCRLYAGVSKTLLNYVDWNAVGEKQDGVGVPEVAKAVVWRTALPRYLFMASVSTSGRRTFTSARIHTWVSLVRAMCSASSRAVQG